MTIRIFAGIGPVALMLTILSAGPAMGLASGTFHCNSTHETRCTKGNCLAQATTTTTFTYEMGASSYTRCGFYFEKRRCSKFEGHLTRGLAVHPYINLFEEEGSWFRIDYEQPMKDIWFVYSTGASLGLVYSVKGQCNFISD